MEAKNSAATATTTDREISTTRIFNAPRELVWQAWTDPKHIEQWWGPNGFTTTTKEFDLRKGGVWNHVMHGPDGTDYKNEITYTEIIEPERIKYEHGPSLIFQVTVDFDHEGPNTTRLSMRMLVTTKAERDRTVEKFGAIEGQQQTLNRLEEYLEKI
jgi:uncharacterized protein YndB with AHSA1/START domain